MNKEKIKELASTKGDKSADAISKRLNISFVGVQRRLAGQVDWRLQEVVQFKKCYEVSDADILSAFFE